jgi:alkanesulfonate monooxygenase SsuD/methylene tetrahydromethanopterin reductase-like flavin-dependent oxidoreductase (luciferase family)
MLRLAGREADGVVLTCCSADDVAAVVPTVREAAATAGRGEPQIVAWITVCPDVDGGVDAGPMRQAARRRLAGYLTAPPYAAFQRARGRAALLAPLWEAWSAGDRRGAVAAVPEGVVDDLVVHGTPLACHEQLDRFVAAGVTTLVLEVLPGTVDPLAALLALAPRGG